MQNTPEFKAHVDRMFTPFKPGLAYVRTAEFVAEFEETEYYEDLSPDMLERARDEAVKCVAIIEESIKEQCGFDAERFVQLGGVDPGWNATNLDELKQNLTGFCDVNMGLWEREDFPEYKERNPDVLDARGFEYVESFICFALAALPNHAGDGDESIYYDSDSTVELNEP